MKAKATKITTNICYSKMILFSFYQSDETNLHPFELLNAVQANLGDKLLIVEP